MEVNCAGLFATGAESVSVRVTEPVVMLSERVAVSVRASGRMPFNSTALALAVFPRDEVMMIAGGMPMVMDRLAVLSVQSGSTGLGQVGLASTLKVAGVPDGIESGMLTVACTGTTWFTAMGPVIVTCAEATVVPATMTAKFTGGEAANGALP